MTCSVRELQKGDYVANYNDVVIETWLSEDKLSSFVKWESGVVQLFIDPDYKVIVVDDLIVAS